MWAMVKEDSEQRTSATPLMYSTCDETSPGALEPSALELELELAVVWVCCSGADIVVFGRVM